MPAHDRSQEASRTKLLPITTGTRLAIVSFLVLMQNYGTPVTNIKNNHRENDSYWSQYFSTEITERLEAAAFRSLRAHLQDRSNVVSNMEMMTTTGFCRNCLAKWMVLAARDLADELDRSCPTTLSPNATIAALDSFGYAQATEYVYGMPYDTWKQQYQRQATADEMKRYKESESIHVKHELSRLEQRDRNTASAVASNVCCEPTPLPRTRASVEEFYNYTGSFKFAVLTVSDRAFRGEYDTGDLSGPAVVETLQSLTSNIASIEVAIVPDEKQDIQSQLVKWCDNIDVILTTGGTGFSRRDVTPEATREILDVEWRAVMTLSRANVLSRGTAGFRKNTVIANLPGNPKAAREILPALLPVLWNATLELQQDVDESQVATTLNLENFPVVEP